MDQQNLQLLQTALAATPDNHALRAVLLNALFEQQQFIEAGLIINNYDESSFAGDERLLCARVYQALKQPEKVLQYADGEQAEALLLQARALLSLQRTGEAREAYQAAVKINPTLEDTELKKTLSAKVREFPASGDRPRLKVIANDDTDASEVNRLLMPEQQSLTFTEVGGLEDIKQQIHKKIILPFQKPSLFQRFKKRVGGGILMYGPPGCGKTLLARATAGECNASFYNIDIADVLDMYIGESERKLHAVFELARNNVPAVMFFDELEALGGKRQYSREGTSSKLVSQFLAEMDGFSKANQGVLILAATNVPWAIDPAFRRPGRFDRVLFVPPPDRQARCSILDILLADKPTEKDLDTDYIAMHTRGFSGADLEALVETAVDEAIEASLEQGSEMPVTDQHLKAALRQVKPTTLEWLTTARNYARYANESGQYNDVLEFLNKYSKA